MSDRITEEEFHLISLAKELIDTIENKPHDTRRYSAIASLSFDIYRMGTQATPHIDSKFYLEGHNG